MKNQLKVIKLLIRTKFNQSLVMKETSTDRHIVQTNLKNLKLSEPIVSKHMSYSELAVSEKFI